MSYRKLPNVTLKRLRHSHHNNVIFSYLNINSISNEFGDLNKIVDGNIGILRIAEAKLDESFRNNQFVYQYNISSPYILDIEGNKRDLTVFVKSRIA